MVPCWLCSLDPLSTCYVPHYLIHSSSIKCILSVQLCGKLSILVFGYCRVVGSLLYLHGMNLIGSCEHCIHDAIICQSYSSTISKWLPKSAYCSATHECRLEYSPFSELAPKWTNWNDRYFVLPQANPSCDDSIAWLLGHQHELY